MIADYKIVNDLFMTEVQLEIENRFPMLDMVDIPISVTVTYSKKQKRWNCTCTMIPFKTYEYIRFRRCYTTEMTEAIKEIYDVKPRKDNECDPD